MLMIITSMVDSEEDKRKVEKLYEKYHKIMYTVAYKILNQKEDAEDAVLESWEKIIRHLEKIKEIDCQETKGFIVIIVERTAIDIYRKNKKNQKVQVLFDEYEESPYFATKDEQLDNLELYQVLRSIPKIYSDVLILFYVNNFSGKEIANLLHIKEDTVMARLSRGRKYLRKELDGHE